MTIADVLLQQPYATKATIAKHTGKTIAEVRRELLKFKLQKKGGVMAPDKLLEIIIKGKDHLMIDVTGLGEFFAETLEAYGIKIDRVRPEPGSKNLLFRVEGAGRPGTITGGVYVPRQRTPRDCQVAPQGIFYNDQLYVSPVLATMIGKKITVRIDPADTDVLHLYAPGLNGSYLGIAQRVDQHPQTDIIPCEELSLGDQQFRLLRRGGPGQRLGLCGNEDN